MRPAGHPANGETMKNHIIGMPLQLFVKKHSVTNDGDFRTGHSAFDRKTPYEFYYAPA